MVTRSRSSKRLKNLPELSTEFCLPAEFSTELFLKIFSYLHIVDLLNLTMMSKLMRALALHNVIWKQLYTIHFPNNIKNISNVDWYAEFRATTINHYNDMFTPSQNRILMLVRDGDVDSLRKIEKLSYFDLCIRPRLGITTVLCWIENNNNQEIADLFYGIVKKELSSKRSKIKDQTGNDLLWWALTLKQSSQVLQSLREGGSVINKRYQFKEMIGPEVSYHVLHLAIKKGAIAFAIQLIKEFPDSIEQTTEKGETPLIWAVKYERLEIVRELIAKNAALNCFTKIDIENNNRTAFYYAVKNNYTEIAMALLTAGAVITTEGTALQPIHEAARNGNLELILAMIKKDSSLVQALDFNRKTPLLHSEGCRHLQCI